MKKRYEEITSLQTELLKILGTYKINPTGMFRGFFFFFCKDQHYIICDKNKAGIVEFH